MKRNILKEIMSLVFILVMMLGLISIMVRPASAAPYDSNLLTNGDAETGTLVPWTTTGAIFMKLATTDPGFQPPKINNGGYVFDYYPSAVGSETLSQTIDVSSFSADIALGIVNVSLSAEARKCYSASDATIKLELLDANDGVLAMYMDKCESLSDKINVWETLSINQSAIPSTTAKLKVSLIATINTNNGEDYIEFDGVSLKLSKSAAAPTLNIQSENNLTKDSVKLNFTSDTAGTYYYLVSAAGDPAPDASTIEAQGTSVAKGSGPAVAATANTINVTGLSAETAYNAYVIVKNAAGASNVRTVPIYTSFTNGLGTSAEPYEIASAAELTYMSNVVNNFNEFYKDKCYKLTADISLNNTSSWASWPNASAGLISWIPIGDASSNLFSGSFDGNAHIVSGIYINTGSTEAQGLFGYMSGTIENLGVTESYINAPYYIGGIAGKTASAGGISDCYFSGKIDGSKNGSNSDFGGIVGYSEGAITDCYNTGTVTGTGDSIGGIVGFSNKTINGCYNMGPVTGAANYVGGIMGSSGGTATFCYNKGVVTGLNYVGGIVGNSSAGTITNCYNRALVKATDVTYGYAGGISGNSGTSPITNCYSTEIASGVKSGGLVGEVSSLNVNYCYWQSIVPTDGAGSGSLDTSCTSKTIAEMQAASFVLLLNSHKGSTGIKGWITGSDNYPDFGTPSSDASLKTTSTVKGVAITDLGMPNSLLGSVVAGSVTITPLKAADLTGASTFVTLFDTSNGGATVKAVKYANGSTVNFAADMAYANESIINGDFFIIMVTAQDTTTINYYKVVVTVFSEPSATTSAASGVGATGATLNGTVNANNDNTAVTFQYGLTTAYGTTVTANESPVTGSSVTDVSKSISGLTPNTLFHYRVVGVNGGGTNYGSDLTFTTIALAPTAVTNVVGSLSTTGATLNGTLNANNSSTMVTFAYGLTTSYGTMVTAAESPVIGVVPTAVSMAITGLIPNTTYYYRVVGVNSGGTTNGLGQSFTTLAMASTATTNVASSVSTTGATLNGTVNANNSNTTVAFEYGLTTGYGTSVSATPSTAAGTSVTSVSKAITGLASNTMYHYRVVGVNSGGTTNGLDQTFTTLAPLPTVTSISPTQGPLTGGTVVTIIGTGFVGSPTVTIGGNSATGVTVVNPTTIMATIPAGTVGMKDVVVTTTVGSATGTNLLTYTPDLMTASVSITTPVLGQTPENVAAVQSATNNADYTVTGLVWNEALTTGGKFKSATAYTATVTLTSKNGKEFQAAAFTPIVSGASSVATTTTSGTGVGNTVSFTVTYAATGAKVVSEITVNTPPSNLIYTEGDHLNLSGLVATLTYNDGSAANIALADFGANGITATPSNGTLLSIASHNGNPVMISCNGHDVTTNSLTVSNVAPVEIPAFNAINNVNAGTAGSVTYANAAAVIAVLPTSVTTTANYIGISVPVIGWTDTDGYNPNVAGSYTFTAVLGIIPGGYTNTGNHIATVEVVVGARSNSGGGGSSSSSGGGGSSSGPASITPPGAAPVIVNGETQTAGTAVTAMQSGQTKTTVTVDSTKLEKILETKDDHATVVVPLTNGSDVAIAGLTGQMVKNMETKSATLEVRTNSATYTLPASEIKIDAISKEMGQSVTLADINVEIQIAEPTATVAKVVESSAKAGDFTIMVPAVAFSINCTYKGKKIDVTKFKSYVERTIAIPDGVDPTKITTGIVVNADGTTHHVPTQIVQINGKYYAKINSLFNSVYAVVWHPVKFADVATHWAKDAVNNMGSRMVVTGIGNGNFNPNSDITRAEFAAIVVRALGLEAGTGENKFSDIKTIDWFCPDVETANKYGIISGYNTNTFAPNDKITREQAMSMIARAMKLTGLNGELADNDIAAQLANYTDSISAAGYAKTGIAACLKTGVVSGITSNSLAPKNNITRAEVAAIVQRLLQKSHLI